MSSKFNSRELAYDRPGVAAVLGTFTGSASGKIGVIFVTSTSTGTEVSFLSDPILAVEQQPHIAIVATGINNNEITVNHTTQLNLLFSILCL